MTAATRDFQTPRERTRFLRGRQEGSITVFECAACAHCRELVPRQACSRPKCDHQTGECHWIIFCTEACSKAAKKQDDQPETSKR